MSGPSTSITGGDLPAFILAIVGVGYFVLNVIRKPKVETDPKTLQQLIQCREERARDRYELSQLREWKRARMHR